LNKLTETISAIQKAIHIHVSRVLKTVSSVRKQHQ